MRWLALVAIAMVGVPSVSWAKDPVTVAAEDRQRIADLISQSAYAYDSKDVEGYLDLFTQDCLLEMYAGSEQRPIVKATGREELGMVTRQRLTQLTQKGIQSRHYQTNTVLTPRRDGRIEGVTMLNLMWQAAGEKPVTVTTGIYRDLFEKTDRGWRFAKRSLFIDQTALGK